MSSVCCPYCCSPISKIVFDEISKDYVCVICDNRLSVEEYESLTGVEICSKYGEYKGN